MFQQRNSTSPFNGIIGIIFALVVFYLLFKLAGFIFSILWSASPIIFLAALYFDSKGVMDYGKSVLDLFKRNWAYGLIASILTVVLFPLVSVYLLGKGLFKRKMAKAREDMEVRTNGELIDYEEIDSEIIEMELPPSDLPPDPVRRTPPQSSGSRYDDLFE